MPSPYLNQWWPRSVTHICSTRWRWVNFWTSFTELFLVDKFLSSCWPNVYAKTEIASAISEPSEKILSNGTGPSTSTVFFFFFFLYYSQTQHICTIKGTRILEWHKSSCYIKRGCYTLKHSTNTVLSSNEYQAYRLQLSGIILCLYAPSQWETTLHSNVVSHWLGAYAKWYLGYAW